MENPSLKTRIFKAIDWFQHERRIQKEVRVRTQKIKDNKNWVWKLEDKNERWWLESELKIWTKRKENENKNLSRNSDGKEFHKSDSNLTIMKDSDLGDLNLFINKSYKNWQNFNKMKIDD